MLKSQLWLLMFPSLLASITEGAVSSPFSFLKYFPWSPSNQIRPTPASLPCSYVLMRPGRRNSVRNFTLEKYLFSLCKIRSHWPQRATPEVSCLNGQARERTRKSSIFPDGQKYQGRRRDIFCSGPGANFLSVRRLHTDDLYSLLLIVNVHHDLISIKIS